jgi:hypothetical protein
MPRALLRAAPPARSKAVDLARLRRALGIAAGKPDVLGGLRLACAFLAPIALGEALGKTLSGLFVGIGAFMVANADLGGPYATRARVQLAAGAGVVASIVLGMLCGDRYAIALPLATLVVMAGAMAGAIGPGAAIVGVLASFGLVIGIGIAGTPADQPLQRAAELGVGAVLAMALSLAPWPLSHCDRHGPQSPRPGARSQPSGKLDPRRAKTRRRRPSEHWRGHAQRSRRPSSAAMSPR